MKLNEITAKLMELGNPDVNVGCYKDPNAELHVQIRTVWLGSTHGLRWTWFGFAHEDEDDLTLSEISVLYAEAAASDEWYLDEIEIDLDPQN